MSQVCQNSWWLHVCVTSSKTRLWLHRLLHGGGAEVTAKRAVGTAGGSVCGSLLMGSALSVRHWMQPVRTGEERLSENSAGGSGSLKGGTWGPGSTFGPCRLITGLLGARVCGSQMPVRHTGRCGGSARSLHTERS